MVYVRLYRLPHELGVVRHRLFFRGGFIQQRALEIDNRKNRHATEEYFGNWHAWRFHSAIGDKSKVLHLVFTVVDSKGDSFPRHSLLGIHERHCDFVCWLFRTPGKIDLRNKGGKSDQQYSSKLCNLPYRAT